MPGPNSLPTQERIEIRGFRIQRRGIPDLAQKDVPDTVRSRDRVLLGAAQARQSHSGRELALEVSLEALDGEAAKVGAPASGPRFGGKGGCRRAEDANRQNLGIRRQRDAMRPIVPLQPVIQTNQAIRE
jgi:hypothetical protein